MKTSYIYSTCLLLIFSSNAYSQTREIPKYSFGGHLETGVYSGFPVGKIDNRRFQYLNDYDVSDAQANHYGIGGEFMLNFKRKRGFLKTELNYFLEKYSYTQYRKSGFFELSKINNFKHDLLNFSLSYGYRFNSVKLIHGIGIGTAIDFFDRMNSNSTTVIISSFLANSNKPVYYKEHASGFTRNVYLNFYTLHFVRLRNQFITISPQLNVGLMRSYSYEYTPPMRQLFVLKLGYLIGSKKTTEIDTFRVKQIKNPNNNKLILFSHIGAGFNGAIVALNLELSALKFEYGRLNVAFGYSPLTWTEGNVVPTLLPGLNYTFMRKKWKTQLGANAVLIQSSGLEFQTVNFNIARVIESKKGYFFKFGFGTIKADSPNSILVLPFISFGRGYSVSDL